MRLEVVDELIKIVGACPYFALQYLAWFLNCWENIIVGWLKEFVPNHGRERLQIVKLLLDR